MMFTPGKRQPMYSKTSLGADQLSVPALSARGKRILWLAIGVVLAAGLALGVWAAVGGDRYGSSANGCVNFTIANSTGGSLIHYCGTGAKSFCRSAYTHSDEISMLGRPQCALAGLPAAKVAAG
jgi:hypothetical protein